MKTDAISFKVNDLSSRLWTCIGWGLLFPCAAMFSLAAIVLERIILGQMPTDNRVLSIIGSIGICLVSCAFFILLIIHNVYSTFCRIEFRLDAKQVIRSIILGSCITISKKQWQRADIVDIYIVKPNEKPSVDSVGSFRGSVLNRETVVPEFKVYLKTNAELHLILVSEFVHHANLCKLFLSELDTIGEF